VDAWLKSWPKARRCGPGGSFCGFRPPARSEDLVGLFTTGKADHLELRRQVTAGGDVVEGGDELAIGEIARGTEDDDGAGLRAVTGEQRFLEGVFQIADASACSILWSAAAPAMSA
jgi:hypothetical protein